MSACGCGSKSEQKLPVAVIGAGPVGLAAASQLLVRGEPVLVFETGNHIGENIRQWQHVRMFSPWKYNVDEAAKELLAANAWSAPVDDELPTGQDLLEKYLVPLSELPALKSVLHLNAKVVGIARKNLDKVKSRNREHQPFTLLVQEEGRVQTYQARAVIDASGNWANPNPVLSMGVWTSAERALRDYIFYGIPTILAGHRQRYAGKRVMVVGGGHSAINALLYLATLKTEVAETEIVWVLRKSDVSEAYGGEDRDGLPARGGLGIRVRSLVEAGQIRTLTPFQIEEIVQDNGTLKVSGTIHGQEVSVSEIDEVIAATGGRPDLSFLTEIRLSLDPVLDSVAQLAPLIDPNEHSCGTVRPHGELVLRHPEKDFYIVGVKSYGRAPTFLLATGYEQVRSVVAGLAGDWESAAEVHLELPETGVCRVDVASGDSGSQCCGPTTVQSCCR